MKAHHTQHTSNGHGEEKCSRFPATEAKAGAGSECGNTIVDHKVTLLAAAVAAMSIEGEPCIDEILPGLKDAGINKSDIQWGIEHGRFTVACAEVGTRALEKVCEEAQERHHKHA